MSGTTGVGGNVVTRGNGTPTTQARMLSGFNQISIRLPISATVVEGQDFSISITIDSNLQALVSTRVEGQTLVVESLDGFETSIGAQTRITLPLLTGAQGSGASCMSISGLKTPAHMISLDASGASEILFSGNTTNMTATVSGASDLEVTGSASDFSVEASGASTVRWSGTASDLSVIASGASEAALSGSASQLSVTASGASHVDADALDATDGELDASAASVINATVDGTVSLEATTASQIEWSGTAMVESEEADITSSIEHF